MLGAALMLRALLSSSRSTGCYQPPSSHDRALHSGGCCGADELQLSQTQGVGTSFPACPRLLQCRGSASQLSSFCSLGLEPVAGTESLLCPFFPLVVTGLFPAPPERVTAASASLVLAGLSPLCPPCVPALSPLCACWAAVKRAGHGACAQRADRAQSCACVGCVGTHWCLGEVWCHSQHSASSR